MGSVTGCWGDGVDVVLCCGGGKKLLLQERKVEGRSRATSANFCGVNSRDRCNLPRSHVASLLHQKMKLLELIPRDFNYLGGGGTLYCTQF